MPPEKFSDHTKSTSDDPYHGIHPQIVEDFLLEGGRCTPTAKEPTGDCLSRLLDPEKYYPRDRPKSDSNSIQEKALEEVLTRVLSNGSWQFKPSKESEQFVSFTLPPICEFVHPQSEFAKNSRLQSPNAMEEAMLRNLPQGIKQEDAELQKFGPYRIPPNTIPPAQKPYGFRFYKER